MPSEPALIGEIQHPETGETLHVPVEGAQDEDQVAWLAADLKHQVRYNYSTKTWHRWNGKSRSWRVDDVRSTERDVINMAKERAAILAAVPGKASDVSMKLLRKLYDIHRVGTALETLGTMEFYKTNGQDWDQEPFYLGCPNGIVDLRTGQFADVDAVDSKVTKSTGTHFDPDAECPRWVVDFLIQIASGDEGLGVWYMQWFGYCLFGRNYEQKFLLLTGTGRNGKGALAHAVRHAIGEYDAAANQGLYMKSRFGSARSSEARSDVMTLKGTRFAVMSEPEGGEFNEELLKAHTGGDPIVARPLYGKEIKWEPTHTPTFLTNRPPSVDDVGPAMAERILVADFREKYEGRKADTTLYDRLEAERIGILATMVRYAAAYWASRAAGGGLWYPKRVIAASKSYIDANDPLGMAIQEAFVVEQGARAVTRDLYKAYLDWHNVSDDASEALSLSAFGLLMHRKGFNKRRTEFGIVYLGVRPKSAMELAVE